MNRIDALQRLRDQSHAGQSIAFDIAQVDGNGALQFCNDDRLTFVYHTSRFPKSNQIAGLLPLADANGAILDLAKTNLPLSKPLIAGVYGSDPFRLIDKLLVEIKNAGFVGVQNFPTLGVMDGGFRQHLEASQFGYAREVEMILTASSLGLLTMPLVFTVDEGLQMLNAGADVLVLHPGAKAFRKDFPLNEFAAAAAKMAERITVTHPSAFILRHDRAKQLVPPVAP